MTPTDAETKRLHDAAGIDVLNREAMRAPTP